MLVGVVAVVLVLFTGWQALQAKEALADVADDFTELSEQLTAGDSAAARETLADAQADADRARSKTDGPGWWLTSRIPGVGPNVVAVRTVADVTDELATGVLPGVVEATETLKPANLRPRGRRIDLEPLTAVAPQVVASDERLQTQVDRVRGLDVEELAPQLAAPVRLLQDKLQEAASLSKRASLAVRLLPPMLGAEGRRDYLMLFQNNAEVRATGGIPGAFAVVTADHGRITLGKQGDAATIGRFEEPPIPLTGDEVQLFGENLGRYPQDVNFTPDFPRSAQLIRAMWNERHGLQVDGVLSTDPVALSYLLRGTGPVPLAGGRTLTADNAVSLLLSDVYAEIKDPTRQNIFFASVARNVFEAVTSGQGEPQAVLDALAQGGDERRLLVWSSHPEEQALLGPTRLGGVLATEPQDFPRVGVFLNDGTGAKMDYYLDYSADLRADRCVAGRQHLTVELSLRSLAPADASTLPDYVAESVAGAPRGTIRTTLLLYAPVGGWLESARLDGGDQQLAGLEHDGRALTRTTLDLAPGQRRSLTLELVSGRDQTGQPTLRVTPGARGPGVGTVTRSACS
ncbi:DUF4012 domain-containing protein [Nocardioides mesophilus]|uniref:DUF4012 domain-containing protein n=1 Tax=Nocardioides mesophilus TaxID=433659 RepID=A0A7G9REC1_9ACTN|nr:DUF4012 domain-containing protein [Nocardioides mesophilus]QNN53946.1 DUF4012 domain-containing protein [Nocardioides mesophilus]